MNIHALWCHPRSVSTAVERVMRERGDLDVLHEPFMYAYYFSRPEGLFPDFEPDADHPRTYGDIRRMILARAETGPVFFKDMAFYALADLQRDNDFLNLASHCFLVRDPAESILSYHRRDPNFSLEEVGIEAQYRLFRTLRSLGADPFVMTAADLRADPQATLGAYWAHVSLAQKPDAFSWNDTVPQGWESVKRWHEDTLTSGAIRSPVGNRDYAGELNALGPPFTDYDAHHRPFYMALRTIAEQQSRERMRHQK